MVDITIPIHSVSFMRLYIILDKCTSMKGYRELILLYQLTPYKTSFNASYRAEISLFD